MFVNLSDSIFGNIFVSVCNFVQIQMKIWQMNVFIHKRPRQTRKSAAPFLTSVMNLNVNSRKCVSCCIRALSPPLIHFVLTPENVEMCIYRVVVIIGLPQASALPVDPMAGAGWREGGGGVLRAAGGQSIRGAGRTVLSQGRPYHTETNTWESGSKQCGLDLILILKHVCEEICYCGSQSVCALMLYQMTENKSGSDRLKDRWGGSTGGGGEQETAG